MSTADLTAVIDGDTKGLMAALKGGDAAMKDFEATTGASLKKVDSDFKSTFSGIQNAIGELKTALAVAAPFAILGVLHDQLETGIKDWTKIGDAADKAALSTDFFQTLAFKAAEAHIETDKLADGLNKFAQQLAEIKHGHGDFYDWLKDNDGTLLKALQGVKTVEDGVKAVSAAMQKSDDPVEQARLAIKAFGQEHRDLYRVLNDGTDGLAKAAAEARRYGVIIDEEVIRKAQDSKDGVSAVSKVLMNEFRQALLIIAPLLQDVGRLSSAMATGMRDVRDMFQSTAEGLSNSGLNDQLRIHAENLAKLRTQLEALKSGKGAGGFSIGEMFGLGPTDEEKLNRTTKAAEEEIAALNRLTAERDKRAKESAERNKNLNTDFFANNGDEKDKDQAAKLLEGQRAMDSLMQRYYTDTHQYYQAIEADAQKEKDRFKLLLEEKKISAQQYQIAMVLIAKDEAAKIDEAYNHTREHIRTAMQGISGEFESIFSKWQNGQKVTLASIEKDFIQMIERMVLKAAVLEPLFGTGKTGPGEFGLFGGVMQSALGSGGISSLLGGFKFHEGGTVGSGGSAFVASPSIFAGAVRYHEGGIAGLLPGEVPAILQKGETVIPVGGSQSQSATNGGHSFAFSIDARGAEIGVETKIQAALQAALPQFTKQAVAAVATTAHKKPGYLR